MFLAKRQLLVKPTVFANTEATWQFLVLQTYRSAAVQGIVT